MKTGTPIPLLILATAVAWYGRIAFAEEMFYRITSTQQTGIVSFDRTGNLQWSNSHTPSVCGMERAPQLDQSWEPHLDPVVVTATTAHVIVPLSPSVPVTQQKFLFEFSHVDGWGFGHAGFYVDRSGFTYTYYHPNPTFTDPTNSVFTAEFLETKTASNRMYLTTVETSELQTMWNLLPLAATGSVSNPRQVANDLGISQFRGFILNDDSNAYAVVLLRMEGDMEVTNSAPEATVLVNWLGSLVGRIPPGWFGP